MSYQLKLDFGEGEGCQEAYQDFLKANDLEDTNESWVTFSECWKHILQMEAMLEKRGKTVQ